MKNKKQHDLCERIFKISKVNNTISLEGSLSIVNRDASEENFQNEAFEIRFTSIIKNTPISFNILITANECFKCEDILALQQKLDIKIEGCGMFFKVLSYSNDFSIQFDTKNSAFIDTHFVKGGAISFKSIDKYKHFT